MPIRRGFMTDVLLIDLAGWGMIYCAAKVLGVF